MRTLIGRLRARHRASIGYQLRHENPRGLSRQEYESELRAQGVALKAAMRDEDVPSPIEELKARKACAEVARRAHYAPTPTREQEVAMLRADAIQQCAPDTVRRRRVVY